MNKYVIIGNGVAGVEAAKAIRDNDNECDIILISNEKVNLYYRPRLIEYLADKVEFEKILTYNEKWYEDRNIKRILGQEVIDICVADKNITLDSGEKIEYTKLLMANGANPFVPAVEGAGKNGVFVVRDKRDVECIKEYIKDKKKAVVIGGGLLGLELANSLHEDGLDVTILEFMDRLLPRQLDKAGALVLEKLLEEKGLKFRLNEGVGKIVGDTKITKVLLTSGNEIETDVVIISAGIRPRRDLADKAELTFNKGLIVNEYMQTSNQEIYAAGDVIEYNGMLYGLWLPAKEQGALAGKNMVTENTENYTPGKIETRLKVVDISLFSQGKIQGDNLEEKVEEHGAAYEKLFYENGELVGAIVIGNNKEAIRISKMMK